MTRFSLFIVCVLCAWGFGCSDGPAPEGKAAKTTGDAATDNTAKPPPEQDEPPLEVDVKEKVGAAGAGSTAGDGDEAGGLAELKLEDSGITFKVPASWKRIKPPNRVVEAAFELPRAAGDEDDGRLTLMSAGGEPEVNLAHRKAEFRLEVGEEPAMKQITINGREASLIDLRGEWRGTFGAEAGAPRSGYRMLYLMLPHSAGSGFYAKLVGPRATVAAHEEAFREFLRSGKFTREAAR